MSWHPTSTSFIFTTYPDKTKNHSIFDLYRVHVTYMYARSRPSPMEKTKRRCHAIAVFSSSVPVHPSISSWQMAITMPDKSI